MLGISGAVEARRRRAVSAGLGAVKAASRFASSRRSTMRRKKIRRVAADNLPCRARLARRRRPAAPRSKKGGAPLTRRDIIALHRRVIGLYRLKLRSLRGRLSGRLLSGRRKAALALALISVRRRRRARIGAVLRLREQLRLRREISSRIRTIWRLKAELDSSTLRRKARLAAAQRYRALKRRLYGRLVFYRARRLSAARAAARRRALGAKRLRLISDSLMRRPSDLISRGRFNFLFKKAAASFPASPLARQGALSIYTKIMCGVVIRRRLARLRRRRLRLARSAKKILLAVSARRRRYAHFNTRFNGRLYRNFICTTKAAGLVADLFKFTFAHLLRSAFAMAARRRAAAPSAGPLFDEKMFYAVFAQLRDLAARRIFSAACASEKKLNSPFASAHHFEWLMMVLRRSSARFAARAFGPSKYASSAFNTSLFSRHMFFNKDEAALLRTPGLPGPARVHFLI